MFFKKKKASKFFLFGHTSAGKSTLISSIYYYLDRSEKYLPRRNVNNKDGTTLLREWTRRIKEKNFPRPTPSSTFISVDFGYIDLGTREETSVIFYEFAGEDVVKLDPIHPEHEYRDLQLNKWLNDASGIIVIAPAVEEFEDTSDSLQDFWEFLNSIEMLDKPICLIISKWDKVEREGLEPVDIAKRLYYPFLKQLKLHSNSDLFKLSVGEISNIDNKIIHFNEDKGVKEIFTWIDNITRNYVR